MPLPPFARTTTGRSMAALGWVEMARYRADIASAKVQDEPGSVQSHSAPQPGSNPVRPAAPANANGGWVGG